MILLCPMIAARRADHKDEHVKGGPAALITTLRHLYSDWEQHSQRYGGDTGRRRLQTLTAANTAPMRIHFDTKSLYELTAPRYSACFRVNDWYRKGLPRVGIGSESQPPDGEPTCVRTGGTVNTDCWGVCEKDDVITPVGRDRLVQVVSKLVAELPAFFSLVPVEGNLTFARSSGKYDRALQQRGYTSAISCARDCMMVSDVAVDEAY